jgi:hypothetical protein
MSKVHMNLTSREAAAYRMDYSTIRHYVETKLSFGLLDEWKEFIFINLRSKKLWGKDQSSGFSWRMITFFVKKDFSGFKYYKILNSVNSRISI